VYEVNGVGSGWGRHVIISSSIYVLGRDGVQSFRFQYRYDKNNIIRINDLYIEVIYGSIIYYVM